MFGKGIYFADLVSKSANYCFATREASRGCMLLCEVALGKIETSYGAKASKLGKTFNSRMGECSYTNY